MRASGAIRRSSLIASLERSQQRPESLGELGPHELGIVAFADAALGTEHLSEGPVDDPEPTARHRPRLTLTGGACCSSRSSSSASRRDLPTPAWPTTVTRCGDPSLTTRSNTLSSRETSSAAPDQGRCVRATQRGSARLADLECFPGGDGLRLPLQRQRLRALGRRRRGRSSAVCARPTRMPPAAAAACSRAATLTASPITV